MMKDEITDIKPHEHRWDELEGIIYCSMCGGIRADSPFIKRGGGRP